MKVFTRIVTISMPDPMYRVLEHKVRDGIYGSVSEYVRTLIRRDLELEIEGFALRRRQFDDDPPHEIGRGPYRP